MSVEFVDTNVLISAHNRSAGRKYQKSAELLTRLFDDATGALGYQALVEFYATATRKLARTSAAAEAVVAELGCAVLWSEDFSHGQRYGSVTVRNPFASV